ncbi:MAG TPA: hypothetical protein VG796_20375 [Verrucomicrobiales bacterium]|jgi:hypothetical protein|nr:hypothetical protein [Verrucomicrobiales bacterium]
MKTAEEWKQAVEIIEHTGEGTTHLFKGVCPICGAEESSTYWGNGDLARKGAAAAIVSHIQREHPAEVAPEPARSAQWTGADINARAMTETRKIRISAPARNRPPR